MNCVVRMCESIQAQKVQLFFTLKFHDFLKYSKLPLEKRFYRNFSRTGQNMKSYRRWSLVYNCEFLLRHFTEDSSESSAYFQQTSLLLHQDNRS
jgi:hypothetical protein